MDIRLLNACLGKSESQGGLNLPEMKKQLIQLFPEQRKEIQKRTRKSLYVFCKKHFEEEMGESRSKYFVEDTPLNKAQMDYCRCLAHVSAKNPPWCYKHGAWKSVRPGTPCYNPYALCTKSTGRKGRFRCAKFYDFENMPKNEVRTLAMMKGLSVPEFKRLAEQERRDSFEEVYY